MPQIRAIKLESLPTPPRAAGLRELLDAHPATSERVAILVGLGALYSFFDLETGAVDGFMTGWAFPELLLAMLAAQVRPPRKQFPTSGRPFHARVPPNGERVTHKPPASETDPSTPPLTHPTRRSTVGGPMFAVQERGDLDLAFDLYRKWLPLIVFEQQPGVAVRKEILGLRGLMGEGVVRHPGGAISQAQQESVRRILDRVVGARTDITRPLGEWR